MATLYITEQGTTLRKVDNRLRVERDDVTLAEIHDFKVERVIVYGNVQISTQAVSFLLDRGIDTCFLSRSGKLRGRLTPLATKNIHLRTLQFSRAGNADFAFSFARSIVTSKIANCTEVLARHQRNHQSCDVGSEIEELKSLSKKIPQSPSRDSLRGIEGQAAAVYFQAFARMLRRTMNFRKRTRRPPKDPVNALLSFGYTLLYNEAIGALAAIGFDPYLGFYHALRYGRCSLALDLIEEMRPIAVDRLTVNLINMEVLKAEDFQSEEGRGVFLSPEARKRFFREYERLMTAEFMHRQKGERTSLRRAIHEQATAVQRAVIDGTTYQSFKGWH